jgi:hypothetical protein
MPAAVCTIRILAARFIETDSAAAVDVDDRKPGWIIARRIGDECASRLTTAVGFARTNDVEHG